MSGRECGRKYLGFLVKFKALSLKPLNSRLCYKIFIKYGKDINICIFKYISDKMQKLINIRNI